MMKRLMAGGLAAIGLVGAIFLSTRLHMDGATYSVRQLVGEIRVAPRTMLGQTISVRAVGRSLWWGTGNGLVAGHQAFLEDDPNGRMATFPYGAKLGNVNRAGATPTLLLVGSSPQPSASKQFLFFLSTLPLLDRFVHADLYGEDIYRIRIVSTRSCPTAFSGFCPTAIVVP